MLKSDWKKLGLTQYFDNKSITIEDPFIPRDDSSDKLMKNWNTYGHHLKKNKKKTHGGFAWLCQ